MNKVECALGNAIKNCRTNRRLTQIELANLIHKSNTTLAKYEKGEISIDVATLVEIAKVLHVPLEYFIEAIKEKSEKPAPPQADSVIPAFFSNHSLPKVYLRLVAPSAIVEHFVSVIFSAEHL